MPFKKVGPDSYVSPRGNKFNEAQVRLYHAQGGKFPGEKKNGKRKRQPVASHAAPKRK